jgi:hypothetical protein
MKTKTKILTVVAVLTAVGIIGATASGCTNYDVIDTTYRYNRAIIHLPNGEVVDGQIDSWRDYEDGDQIQVKVEGITYLIHSSNVALLNY